MDFVYELPYARKPHPVYGNAEIPAYKMIKFSIAIQRGCFGGCTFCSITEHEGRIIQNRSEGSRAARDREDPRRSARLHRRHQRSRRPDRQHVSHRLQDPRDRERLPQAELRVSRHLPESQHRPQRADPALSQGARAAGRQEDPDRERRALRPRRREPRVREGAGHAPRGRLSQDRARGHRRRAAVQDDEARRRRVSTSSRSCSTSSASSPARSST